MKNPSKFLIINIKHQLKERKLSIGKLCKSMGVSRNYINQINDGVGLEKIIRIAHAIGCSPGELLAGL